MQQQIARLINYHAKCSITKKYVCIKLILLVLLIRLLFQLENFVLLQRASSKLLNIDHRKRFPFVFLLFLEPSNS